MRNYSWTYIKYRYLKRYGTAHTYDPKADMWYFYIGNVSDKSVKTVSTDANVDFDVNGNIIGIELFGWDNRPTGEKS